MSSGWVLSHALQQPQLYWSDDSTFARVVLSLSTTLTRHAGWCRGDIRAPRSPQILTAARVYLQGQTMAVTELDFKVERDKATGKDLVVVQEQRVQKNHLTTLAKHVMRFEEIVRDMEVHTPVVAAAR